MLCNFSNRRQKDEEKQSGEESEDEEGGRRGFPGVLSWEQPVLFWPVFHFALKP